MSDVLTDSEYQIAVIKILLNTIKELDPKLGERLESLYGSD